MSAHDAESGPHLRQKRLHFDRYVLDLDRGCLLLDGGEIALRPKTFAILKYLAENPGRLVSKDELFAAVWPNLAITDDVLVQSIGELRRALGDDGPHLIRTVPRRGYRFEAAVSDDATPASAPAALQDRPQDHPLAPPPASRRREWLAALTVVALLAAGALWAGRSLWEAPLHDPAAKTVEIAAKPAIAVLPFGNRSDDTARDYFADGLTQDIINALGRFSELTVMSWNAVFPYKDKPATPADIARNLGVRYQVEGSVRQTGDRVRVTAQLVDGTGRVLWSGSFDEKLADLSDLQDRITNEIAGALAIRVTRAEERRVFDKPSGSLEAYDFVLRARPASQRPTRAGNVEARALLRRALELDPDYAAAYAALAETFYVATSMGWAESVPAFAARAEEFASKALALNASEVRARIVLGRIHMLHQRYEQAKAEMDRAIAINPNDAHGLAGRGNILMWLGETDAAIESLELAQRIDPEMNAFDRFALSLAYYVKRRYDAAIEQAEFNLRRTEGAHFSRIVLAAAYAQQNRAEDAARLAATIRRVDPTFDPQSFGNKFLNPADLSQLRDGLRKAGLTSADGAAPGGN